MEIEIKKIVLLFNLLLGLMSSPFASAQLALADYQVTNHVEGGFSSVGSDTLANLMTLWSEHYKMLYPDVTIQIQAAGSATAPPALIESISTFGPMSRKMKPHEIVEFEQQFGYKPLAIPVAIDALSVYVNKNNPISGLSIAQVDAIFSATRNCGYPTDIKHWNDVGLIGSLRLKSIQLFGRNSISGTYSYFRKKALCKGKYKKNLSEQPGSAAVVQSVATSINGIGYSGIGYKTKGVRIVPLSKKKGEAYIVPTTQTIESGTYPLSRFLYIYINKKPGVALPVVEKEFLKFVLSRQGQEIVVKDGYVALPKAMISKILSKIQ